MEHPGDILANSSVEVLTLKMKMRRDDINKKEREWFSRGAFLFSKFFVFFFWRLMIRYIDDINHLLFKVMLIPYVQWKLLQN